MVHTKPLNQSALHESANSHSQLLMVDLIWYPSSIILDLFDVKDGSEEDAEDGGKSDEDSLLSGFSLTQKP